MKKDLFLVLDGNALLHRAWHAIPPLTTADGRVVNAVYGFTNVIEKMLDKYQPNYMAVAWDLPGKTFRHDAYADYKGTRKKKEPELYDQIPMIQEVLDGYGIPSLSAEGMEADDVIGTLASIYGPMKETKMLIVTGDLDALQLVNKDVAVLIFVKGLSQTKIYDEKAVKDRYELRPDQLIDLKALMGDSSDNIPGIAGVGQKTATELLKEHGSIDEIFRAIEDGIVPEKFAKKFRGKEDEVKAMTHLVTIVRDIDLGGFKAEDATMSEPDSKKLTALFKDLEFKTLLFKYQDEKKDAPSAKTVKRGMIEGKIGGNTAYVHLAEEDITLFDGSVYQKVDEAEAKTILKGKKKIIGHNLKQAMHQLDMVFDADLFDVMVAGYLIDSSMRDLSLEALADSYLSKSIEAFDSELAALSELHKVFEDRMKEDGLEKVMYEIEMPVLPVLYRMEKAGIATDKAHLDHLSKTFNEQLQSLTKRIHKLAGRDFNINSPSQLAEILFEDLGLSTKRIKKTKTGFSTAASELEKMWDTHEIVPLISEYRELAKLKSTYADALPKLIQDDGRIHTSFNQTVAATGRLSSSDPNLQNIPIRTDLGNEIRRAFIAPKGKVLLAADYSQFELRLAADISRDKELLDAFKDGADIHTRTAAKIFGKGDDEVTRNDRRMAKAVNFGILYGMGSRSLGKSVGIKQTEAKEFIERYFELHPGLRSYMDEMKLKAHANEYIETEFGRRRYLPDINSGVQMLVAAAERMAINMPIQGTQADLVKMAMIQVQEWIDKNEIPVKMLLQVHDELVFEIDAEHADAVMKQIVNIMESVWDGEVPLIVNANLGDNWGDLK